MKGPGIKITDNGIVFFSNQAIELLKHIPGGMVVFSREEGKIVISKLDAISVSKIQEVNGHSRIARCSAAAVKDILGSGEFCCNWNREKSVLEVRGKIEQVEKEIGEI